LTIPSNIFAQKNSSGVLKVDATITTISKSGGIAEGSSSIVLKVNKPPFEGICSIYPLNGTYLSTVFKIKCSNWTDSDGFVEKYEFYGKR
jgi:hypothetical protein